LVPKALNKLIEIAQVLVRLDHSASFIVNSNHSTKCEHSLHYCRVSWETT
jgi:hypothetical protein